MRGELLGRQITAHHTQRRQHRGPEPALTPGTDEVLGEVIGAGCLRLLHADADGVGVDHDGIACQDVSHSSGLADGGHDRHTEQPTAGRIVGQAQVLDRFVDVSARSTPSQAYSGVGCDLAARTCNSDVATWPQRNGVLDEVLADNRCTATERVPWCRRCQASLWATLAAMPFNESHRDLSPECDEAESSSVRGYRGPHCPSGHRPRHVLARRKNQMLEVDVTEEAKQVALYRYELTGELYDDDEISISSTTTSPSWSRRSATRSPSSRGSKR